MIPLSTRACKDCEYCRGMFSAAKCTNKGVVLLEHDYITGKNKVALDGCNHLRKFNYCNPRTDFVKRKVTWLTKFKDIFR